jgi:hypothetical protein
MRRRIRLTGRRQIEKSAVRVGLSDLGDGKVITLTLARPDTFKAFPAEAQVSLKLVENKKVEVVQFGTIGRLSSARDLKSNDLVAPSCQIRVADPGFGTKGLLLGSSDTWTLRGDDEKDEENSRGILSFLPDDTAPQSWKLEIRENDYPLVRIDKRIPNAAFWARNNPVFVGTALPTIVRRVFDEILRETHSDDTPWVADWLTWAGILLPGQPAPIGKDNEDGWADWLERLVDQFCDRHELAERLLKAATPEEAQ